MSKVTLKLKVEFQRNHVNSSSLKSPKKIHPDSSPDSQEASVRVILKLGSQDAFLQAIITSN
jgi:hypothetical protein